MDWAHLITRTEDGGDDVAPPDNKPAPQGGAHSKLPPPVSCLSGHRTKVWLSSRDERILRAIQAPGEIVSSWYVSKRETILRALTDNAYA